MNSDQPVMPSSVEILRNELTRQPASQCKVSSLVIFMGDLRLGHHALPCARRQPRQPCAADGSRLTSPGGGLISARPCKCPGGGIGRRAGFRYLWQQCRGSSSLLLGTTAARRMTNHLHRGDLPEGIEFGAAVAVDTEAMGLNPHRDRLCLVQLSAGDGNAHLVQLEPGNYAAPRLRELMADPAVTKRSE